MILRLVEQEESVDAAKRVNMIGTVLVVIDVGFLCVAMGSICAAGYLLRKKMRGRGKKQLGAEEKSATVDPTHLMHIEREVSALMDECESDTQEGQKVAMNRERSQRKRAASETAPKTGEISENAQRAGVPEPRRSFAVSHCGLFEAVCIPTWRNYC